jgi:hypothetical protein
LSQVFIIGFGKFGKKALERVTSLWGEARIWIIDHSPEALAQKKVLPGIRVLADGPQFLTKYQDWIKDEDWVVPALPVHLAWKWLDLNLKIPNRPEAVSPPQEFGYGLPYCEFFGQGLYLSYASFVCPENCPAPRHHCFKTKEKRPVPLWQFIAEQRGRNKGLEVIESRQLAPGAGGYPFGELRRIRNQAMVSPRPFFVATACRCHGVIHGLTW